MTKEVKTITDYATQLSQSEETCELSAKQAKTIIDVFFRMIKEDINEAHDVRINNFGTFKLRTKPARAERQGRNPSNGETITIAAQPEKQVIGFKPSKITAK
jgi:nucleoid DNA-binding protein